MNELNVHILEHCRQLRSFVSWYQRMQRQPRAVRQVCFGGKGYVSQAWRKAPTIERRAVVGVDEHGARLRCDAYVAHGVEREEEPVFLSNAECREAHARAGTRA